MVNRLNCDVYHDEVFSLRKKKQWKTSESRWNDLTSEMEKKLYLYITIDCRRFKLNDITRTHGHATKWKFI